MVDVDLGRPVNHAGRTQALWSGPTEQCLRSGMPSLGEAPSGGAKAFCLLLRFSKVSRRQGGTLSSRYRSNGYVPGQAARPPSRASSLPHERRSNRNAHKKPSPPAPGSYNQVEYRNRSSAHRSPA
ncbi:hypothetical protein ABIC88_002602 [Pseudomonas kilonensis]